MAEPIKMPFGFYARMGPRNLVRWGPAVLRDVAMATYFGTQIAKAGFVGYNFGCMIAVATCCLAYLRIKWYLDPSSRLATIDMGRKLGALPHFGGIVSHLTM